MDYATAFLSSALTGGGLAHPLTHLACAASHLVRLPRATRAAPVAACAASPGRGRSHGPPGVARRRGVALRGAGGGRWVVICQAARPPTVLCKHLHCVRSTASP
eukprot:EG_transcript_55983